jgi:hypothetical protein
MAVDSATGQILSRYGNPVAASRGVKCLEPKAIKDNDRDEQCDALAAANNVLMIGKTGALFHPTRLILVYHLTITSAKEAMWDVTYTEWTPNMIDSRLSGHYVKVQDDLYICPSSDGQIYMHNPAHGSPSHTACTYKRTTSLDENTPLLRNQCLRCFPPRLQRSLTIQRSALPGPHPSTTQSILPQTSLRQSHDFPQYHARRSMVHAVDRPISALGLSRRDCSLGLLPCHPQ